MAVPEEIENFIVPLSMGLIIIIHISPCCAVVEEVIDKTNMPRLDEYAPRKCPSK